MNRGRGRTPYGRGRNSPTTRWAPCSYDQSKHPLDPVAGDGSSGSKSWPAKDGMKSYQQTSGSSCRVLVSQTSYYYKQSSSSSCEGDDESVKVTTCQLKQSVPDTSSACSEDRTLGRLQISYQVYSFIIC
ncbi:uncharacterized protein LOC114711846 [Neltuma alba]|uniref:uncharacterized protein LOC114711846 n=1 Tax=Neltuma alba TaxID=207710 RepID=UPI0010A3E4D3|nr:uncharacterized protein LOC114711846 [Prosopis alba]